MCLAILWLTTFFCLIQALSWGQEMLAMGGQGPGYMHTVIITPYMHSLIYHVPVMLKRHGSLQKFSGQGIYLFNFSKKIRYSGTQPYRHLACYFVPTETDYALSTSGCYQKNDKRTQWIDYTWLLINWSVQNRCWEEKWRLVAILPPENKPVGCRHKPPFGGNETREIARHGQSKAKVRKERYLVLAGRGEAGGSKESGQDLHCATAWSSSSSSSWGSGAHDGGKWT